MQRAPCVRRCSTGLGEDFEEILRALERIAVRHRLPVEFFESGRFAHVGNFRLHNLVRKDAKEQSLLTFRSVQRLLSIQTTMHSCIFFATFALGVFA